MSTREQQGEFAKPGQSDLSAFEGAGGSRLPQTNSQTPDGDGIDQETGETGPDWDDLDDWEKAMRLMDQFKQEHNGKARRAASVEPEQKLREEVVKEKHDYSGYKARSWNSLLNQFLLWHMDYDGLNMEFESTDGDTITVPLNHSYMPEYGRKYYARNKALERQMLANFDNPHTCMLTFSGSSKNANGEWRCPVDHINDVLDGVQQALKTLRNVMDGDLSYSISDRVTEWHYALVVEPHKSGYGHVHLALFVDGEIEKSDFERVIDTHLRHCDIAGKDAHDYNHSNPKKRCISVNAVGDDGIENLGSYLSEYIGTMGDDLLDRPIEQLMHYAVMWASARQKVRYSESARDLIEADQEEGGIDSWDPETCSYSDENTAESDPNDEVGDEWDNHYDENDGDPEPVWTATDVVRYPDTDDEERYGVSDGGGVSMVAIDGAPNADPRPSID